MTTLEIFSSSLDNRQCIEKAKITLIDSAVKAKENQVAAPVQTGEQVNIIYIFLSGGSSGYLLKFQNF